MDNIKAQQRKEALSVRRSLSIADRRAASMQIVKFLKNIPAVNSAHTILSYCPTFNEVDITPFNQWILDSKKTLALPISLKDGILNAHRSSSLETLHTGLYGIKEPSPVSELLPPETIDLVIVPCVAFDVSGNRLGYGGGYYDRYLQKFSPNSAILVAFDAQKLYHIETEETDISIPVIVTEKQIYTVNPMSE